MLNLPALIFLAALGCGAWLRIGAAEANPTLVSCSLHYGYLMADHWLTVDLARQVERGLSYSSETRNEFEKLRQWLDAAEQQLAEARKLYQTLFGTNSSGASIAQLNKVL